MPILPEEKRWRAADPPPTPPHRMFTATKTKEQAVSRYAKPREIVQSFARLIEEHLRQSDDQPGWHDTPPAHMMADIYREARLLNELVTEEEAVTDFGRQPRPAWTEDEYETIRAHIARAGIALMQLADVWDVLTPEPLDARGRVLPVGTEGIQISERTCDNERGGRQS